MSALQRLFPLLGVPGSIAVLLLASASSFLLLVLQPMERRHEALREEAQSAAKRRIQSEQKLLAVSAPAAKLSAFYDFFNRQHSVTDHLAQLYSLARQAGIEWRQADYRLAESRSLRLAEYSITLPLSGGYGQVRAFLENALAEIPVLTLDHVTIRRKAAADPRVEAEVRLTLFLPRS